MTQMIAFIGGGNMARGLVGGLTARGVPSDRIVVADPLPAQLDALRTGYGVRVTSDNKAAVRDADIVVLAVKPQELRGVVTSIESELRSRSPLVISVAAGVRSTAIQQWTGGLPVVRCMPNRPALQGHGITALYATPDVDAEQRRIAEELMAAVGSTFWLKLESDMDVVTAVSGSGPAYFFLLIEMLEEAARSLGLPPDVSRKLATETAFGSGSMAREATESAAVLRQQVTSKGGTTEAALHHLEANGVRQLFMEAVAAAARRSAQLADELGHQAKE
jgi:pyrroline-5-carboxylate reductase